MKMPVGTLPPDSETRDLDFNELVLLCADMAGIDQEYRDLLHDTLTALSYTQIIRALGNETDKSELVYLVSEL